MKKTIFTILLFLFTTYSLSFADSLDLSGESAILIDADTGQILLEKNPHLKLHPASTTKIMTGILALELGDMKSIVTVDDEVVSLTSGSHIALEPGEQLVFSDLLNAMLIESANDTALAIAKHITGDIDKFVGLMNDKAKELGALNTHFVNPNGLSKDDHLTTAYDLSLMAQYAMQNDSFRDIVSHYTYTIPTTNKKDEERYLKSANRLLFSSLNIEVDGKIVPIKYEGINGIKTGYTPEAKNCLVASAIRGNQKLIAVVLKSNGQEVFSDIHKLLNYGFDNFEKVNIAVKDVFVGNIEVEEAINPLVAAVIKEDLPLSIPKNSESAIKRMIIFEEQLKAPIEKGQIIGRAEYLLDGELIGSVDVVSTLKIEVIPAESLVHKILNKWYIVLIGLIIISRVIFLIRRKNKRRKTYMFKVPNSFHIFH